MDARSTKREAKFRAQQTENKRLLDEVRRLIQAKNHQSLHCYDCNTGSHYAVFCHFDEELMRCYDCMLKKDPDYDDIDEKTLIVDLEKKIADYSK